MFEEHDLVFDENGLLIEEELDNKYHLNTQQTLEEYANNSIEIHKNEEVEEQPAKKKSSSKLKCLNEIEGVQCKRKAVKGTSYCKKCTGNLEEEVIAEETKINGREVAITSMFGLHYAMYLNFQALGSLGDVDLTGLPDDLVAAREDFSVIYGQIYDEYGEDGINKYIGPVYALGLMCVGQVGSRYASNQKKKSTN